MTFAPDVDPNLPVWQAVVIVGGISLLAAMVGGWLIAQIIREISRSAGRGLGW